MLSETVAWSLLVWLFREVKRDASFGKAGRLTYRRQAVPGCFPALRRRAGKAGRFIGKAGRLTYGRLILSGSRYLQCKIVKLSAGVALRTQLRVTDTETMH